MKTIVLLSGGVDSATCLSVALDKFKKNNVAALSIFYAQKHQKELKSARTLSEFYQIPLYQIDLSSIFSDSNCPLILGSGVELELRSYAEQIRGSGSVSSYVPFRNGLILSAAASFAYSHFSETLIYIGVHADDFVGNAYADCGIEFVNAMSTAIFVGTYGKVRVAAPFVRATKADVIKVGLKLKTPYEFTWSCYNGGDKPCGKCATCIDRARAFELNGVQDPALSQ